MEWVRADLLSLPFENASFDSATVGFGIRNVADLEGGLAELARVLRPEGRLGCLEITRPRGVLTPLFRLWFDGLVPLAGKLLPGGAAYAVQYAQDVDSLDRNVLRGLGVTIV